MKNVDVNFFPGWVRKSITFTIDDGNVTLDRKFLDITEPAGLKGTFNINPPLKRLDAEGYRDLYRGYEIANHCKYHPSLLIGELPAPLSNEPFDKETADPSFSYHASEPGLYHVFTNTAWRRFADDDCYIACILDATRELEEVFGKGAIRDFVWPYCEQKKPAFVDRVKGLGFRSIRKTGCVGDSTGFALPADRSAWSYNATNQNMRELSALYDKLPDDGTLKFFCFGVHSHDFERDGNWDALEDFCRTLGNRPNDFWYASVGEIFDYEDAVRALKITETEIRNDSDVALSIRVDGENLILAPHSTLAL